MQPGMISHHSLDISMTMAGPAGLKALRPGSLVLKAACLRYVGPLSDAETPVSMHGRARVRAMVSEGAYRVWRVGVLGHDAGDAVSKE